MSHDVLFARGRKAEAIAHYEGLLDLNPNDNQSIRNVLLGRYFDTDNFAGVRRLLKQYDDPSAFFNYARVLERFLAGDRTAAAAARRAARRANPHGEAYLTGQTRLPRTLPGYFSPGEDNEARICASVLRTGWARHPDAVAWLKEERA